MLALPYTTIRENFRTNPDLHVSSFLVSQVEIFYEVLKATGTKEEDWSVTRAKSEELIKKGEEGMKQDPDGIVPMIDVSLGLTYKHGGPEPVGKHYELLGLPKEDFGEVVKRSMEIAVARK